MSSDYDSHVGALLIGQMVSTCLYGISTLQTYVYFMKCPRDGLELKIWAFVVWALDTVNVCFVCHGIYFWTYGMMGPSEDENSQHEDIGRRSFYISAGLNILVSFLVQSFFVKRVYQLCQGRTRYVLSSALSLMVLANFALGVEAVIKIVSVFKTFSFNTFASLTFSTALPYTLVAVLSDISIAVALIFLLHKRRPGYASPRAKSLIKQVVTFAINRCVLVSVAATLRLIAFAAFPGTGWFISADFVMGKLYANSLMAALNVRRSHQHDTQGTQAESAIFSSVADVSTPSQGTVVPASITPPPRRAIQRAPSALDIIFVDEKGRNLKEEREKREKTRGSSSLDMI